GYLSGTKLDNKNIHYNNCFEHIKNPIEQIYNLIMHRLSLFFSEKYHQEYTWKHYFVLRQTLRIFAAPDNIMQVTQLSKSIFEDFLSLVFWICGISCQKIPKSAYMNLLQGTKTWVPENFWIDLHKKNVVKALTLKHQNKNIYVYYYELKLHITKSYVLNMFDRKIT
ncbi:hypothetical protein ACJX0J_039918, partial [Zea mays]